MLNTQKELLQEVESTYLDATSAQSQYLSASERLAYVRQSFTLTEEQFFLGMKNTLEMLTEKNNLLNAQQEVLQSKYMAIMSIQLLNITKKARQYPNMMGRFTPLSFFRRFLRRESRSL